MVNTNHTQIQEILKTLPIGLYLGHRTPVVYDESGVSYVNLMDGTIHVSGEQVMMGLSNLPDTLELYEVENAIRAILYHELSHVIMTPVMDLCRKYDGEIINIFEDERIETLLSKYYLGVNFKKMCLAINGWNESWSPKTAKEYFYGIVRFRKGPEKFVTRVAKIISMFAGLRAHMEKSNQLYDYLTEVNLLWDDVRNDWPKQESSKQNESKQQADKSEQQDNDPGANGQQDDENKEDGQSESQNDSSSSEEQQSQDTSDESSAKRNNTENDSTSADDVNEDGVNETSDSTGDDETACERKVRERAEEDNAKEINEITRESIAQDMTKLLNTFHDDKFGHELHRLILQHNKKRANRTPMSHGYSGKVAYKEVATRQDYRWFVRKGGNGQNMFGSTHLTLWVDCSGSFYKEIDRINSIIHELNNLVRIMGKEFSFDVVKMNRTNEVVSTTTRLYACGGNCFGPGVEECVRKTSKPGCNNYNVVVWDGDMFSAVCHNRSYTKYYAVLKKAFNNHNTIVVTDRENEKYIKHMKDAHVKVIQSAYSLHFVDALIKLLARVLV